MPWYIDVSDNGSYLNLPNGMRLRLLEGLGYFHLALLHNQTIIAQWNISTASLYEARAQAMTIAYNTFKEMLTHLTMHQPIFEGTIGDTPATIRGCYPPISKCTRKHCTTCPEHCPSLSHSFAMR